MRPDYAKNMELNDTQKRHYLKQLLNNQNTSLVETFNELFPDKKGLSEKEIKDLFPEVEEWNWPGIDTAIQRIDLKKDIDREARKIGINPEEAKDADRMKEKARDMDLNKKIWVLQTIRKNLHHAETMCQCYARTFHDSVNGLFEKVLELGRYSPTRNALSQWWPTTPNGYQKRLDVLDSCIRDIEAHEEVKDAWKSFSEDMNKCPIHSNILSEKDRAEILRRVHSKMRVGKGICPLLGKELQERGIVCESAIDLFPEIKEREPSPEYRYNDAFWFPLDETGNRKRLYILGAAIKKIEGTYDVKEEIGKIEESLKKLKRMLLIPFLLVPLSLFSQHNINREVRMASNIDDLIFRWGYPVDRVNRDGVTECTWYYVNDEMKSYPSWGDRWCTVKVTFRDKQKVDWTWEGNDCR